MWNSAVPSAIYAACSQTSPTRTSPACHHPRAVLPSSEALTFDLALRLATDQDRPGEFEEPTPGYAVFDYSALYYRHLWGHLHTFSLTLENLTDVTYRKHLNRVKEIMPEPGRNLRILHKIFF